MFDITFVFSVMIIFCLGAISNVQNPMVIGFIGNQPPGYGYFKGRIDDVSVMYYSCYHHCYCYYCY